MTTLASVTPRKAGPNVSEAVVVASVVGGDGVALNPALPYPTIDAATGTFSGNMPPANDGGFVLAAVNEVLAKGDIAIRIDSMSAGAAATSETPDGLHHEDCRWCQYARCGADAC
jgi:hypothetical protein